MTNIQWTEQTLNPTTGCDKISPGCLNCYAMSMAKRLKGMGQAKYQNDGNPRTSGPGFGITMHPDTLSEPLRWKKPRVVFVNSMSDLFHSGVTREFLAQFFAVMALTPQHTYQILSKRHARMRSVLNDRCTCGNGHLPGVHFRSAMAWAVSKANPNRIAGVPDDAEQQVWNASWPLPNVHLGVSVENQKWADIRIPALLDTPAAVRFLSMEPLIGPVDITKHLGDAHGIKEPRGRRVLGGAGQRADHRQPGPDLESGCTTERSLGGRDQGNPLQTASSGEQYRGVLAGTSDAGWHQVSRPGASPSLASLRRADSGRSDGESQEWREVGQPAGEPGTGNARGAADACAAGSAAGPTRSVRHPERHGEADTGAGAADQGQAREGRDLGFDSRGLSGTYAAHIADRQGRPAIAWVILGGESGPGARPFNPEWAADLIDQCRQAGAAPFVKQLGSVWARDTHIGGKSVAAHGDTKGGNPGYWPTRLRVREYPKQVTADA